MQIQSNNLPLNYSTSFSKNGANTENSSATSRKPCECNASIQAEKKQSSPNELTEEQQREVEELKRRDQEVRAHELAHLSAAGPYATGGMSFEYRQGPDGERYAVGGEVSIDTSPVANDPEATLRKARQLQAAAFAPAEPSGQDRAVGQQAAQMAARAQQEIVELKMMRTGTDSASDTRNAAPGNNAVDNPRNDKRLTSYTQNAQNTTMGLHIDRHA